MSDDLSHDTHLRAALRHAPDHALAPPAGVSQAILNAARQVHRPMRAAVTPSPAVRITSARPRAFEWLRQWFASPRMAGGLATGLVAALGLGLWLDLGREPVIDRAPSAEVEPRGADVATTRMGSERNDARAAPTAPPEPAAQPAAPVTATPAAPAAPAATTPPDAAHAKRAAPPTDSGSLQRKAELEKRRADAGAPPAPSAAAEPTPSPERGESKREVPADPAPVPAAPAVAAVPPAAARSDEAVAATPDGATKSTAPARAPNELAAATAQRDAASRRDLRMSLAAGRAAAAAAAPGARASVAEANVAADAVAAASPALALLRRARTELSNGQARWSWTAPGSPLMVAFDGAGQHWLARVVQASRGRWTEVTERAGAGDAIEVRWWRDDWPQATLRIEAEGLRWIEHGGRVRYAPLDAATLQRLRSL